MTLPPPSPGKFPPGIEKALTGEILVIIMVAKQGTASRPSRELPRGVRTMFNRIQLG